MSIYYLENHSQLKAVFGSCTAYGRVICTPSENFTLFYGKKEFYVTSVTNELSGVPFIEKKAEELFYAFASTDFGVGEMGQFLKLVLSTEDERIVSVGDWLAEYFTDKDVELCVGIFLGDNQFIPVLKAELSCNRAVEIKKQVFLDSRAEKLVTLLLQEKGSYEIGAMSYSFEDVFETTSSYIARENGLDEACPVDERIISGVVADNPPYQQDILCVACVNEVNFEAAEEQDSVVVRTDSIIPLGISFEKLERVDVFGVESKLKHFIWNDSPPFCVNSEAFYAYSLRPFQSEAIDVRWACNRREFEVFNSKFTVIGELSPFKLAVEQPAEQPAQQLKEPPESSNEEEESAEQRPVPNYNLKEEIRQDLHPEASDLPYMEEECDIVETAAADQIIPQQQQEINVKEAEQAREIKLEEELQREEEALRERQKAEKDAIKARLEDEIEAEKTAEAERAGKLEDRVKEERQELRLKSGEKVKVDAEREVEEAEKHDILLEYEIGEYRKQLEGQTGEDGQRSYTDVEIEQLVEEKFNQSKQALESMKIKHNVRIELQNALQGEIQAQEKAKREEEEKRRAIAEKHRRQQIEMQKRQQEKDREEKEFLERYNQALEERKLQKQRELDEKRVEREELLEGQKKREQEQEEALERAKEAELQEKEQKYQEISRKINQEHQQELEEKRKLTEERRLRRIELENRERERKETLERRRIERQLCDTELKEETTKLRRVEEENEYESRVRQLEEKERTATLPPRGCKTDLRESRTRRIEKSPGSEFETRKVQDKEFQESLQKRVEMSQEDYEKEQRMYETIRERTREQIEEERDRQEKEKQRQRAEELQNRREWEEYEREKYEKLEEIAREEEIERQIDEEERKEAAEQRTQEWTEFWEEEMLSRRKRIEKTHEDCETCKNDRYACYFEAPEIVCVEFKAGKGRRCKSQLTAHKVPLNAM